MSLFEEDSRPTKDDMVSSLYRVKLYHLESEGGWVDVGTGSLTCAILDEFKAPGLILSSENDSSVLLLKSKIQSDDIYERQGGELS